MDYGSCGTGGSTGEHHCAGQIVQYVCAGAECFRQGSEKCAAMEDCNSFAINCADGDCSTASRCQLFTAGLGNVIPGGAWQTYGRLKECSSCEHGSVAAPPAQSPAAKPYL